MADKTIEDCLPEHEENQWFRDKTMDEKLIELETKFSYQEDLLSDLNGIVARQQRQLDELISEMTGIKEQLQVAIERGPAGGQGEQIEKPPHY